MNQIQQTDCRKAKMNDNEKAKEQFISELAELRQEKHERKREEEILRESDSQLYEVEAVAHVGYYEIDFVKQAASWSVR